MNIPHPLISWQKARPEQIALIWGEQSLRVEALLARVQRRAAELQQHGCQAQQCWALAGATDLDFIVNFHALGFLGAAVVPWSQNARVDELQPLLQTLGIDGIVASESASEAVCSLLETTALPICRTGTESASAQTPLVQERFWPLEETRVIVMSSGTTGTPHPVRLTTAQWMFNAFGTVTRLGHRPEDRWLACLPLHHVGGLAILFRSLFLQTTVHLAAHFDAAQVAHLLDAGNISFVSLVPQMLERVANVRRPGPFAPSLRCILLGGAPCPEALLQTAQKQQWPLSVTWGMSETASQIATCFPGEIGALGNCGPSLAFVRVHTQGQPSAPMPLTVQGPAVLGGMYQTRDEGYVDAQHRIHVTGRTGDLIISGGENIVPHEIESVLRTHPQIDDAAVLGVPDPKWGQRPVAILVGDATDLSVATLQTWCRQRLSGFKIPDSFVWRTKLPRDPLGKLRRRQLLELFEDKRNDYA